MERVHRALFSVGLSAPCFDLKRADCDVEIVDKGGDRIVDWSLVTDRNVGMIRLANGNVVDDFDKPLSETAVLQMSWRSVGFGDEIKGSPFEVVERRVNQHVEYVAYLAKSGLGCSTMVLYGNSKNPVSEIDEEVPMVAITVETTDGRNVLIDRKMLDQQSGGNASCSEDVATPEFLSVCNINDQASLAFWVTNFTNEFVKVDLYRQPEAGKCLSLVNVTNPGGRYCFNKINEFPGYSSYRIASDQDTQREIVIRPEESKLLDVEKDVEERLLRSAGSFSPKATVKQGFSLFVDVLGPVGSRNARMLSQGTFWKLTPSVIVKKTLSQTDSRSTSLIRGDSLNEEEEDEEEEEFDLYFSDDDDEGFDTVDGIDNMANADLRDVVAECRSVSVCAGSLVEENSRETCLRYDYNGESRCLSKLTVSALPGWSIFVFHAEEKLKVWGDLVRSMKEDLEVRLEIWRKRTVNVYESDHCVICLLGAKEVSRMLTVATCGHKSMCEDCYPKWCAVNESSCGKVSTCPNCRGIVSAVLDRVDV